MNSHGTRLAPRTSRLLSSAVLAVALLGAIFLFARIVLNSWRGGTPAINAAAAAGDLTEIQKLLREGANINMPSPAGNGDTPLDYAIEAGQSKAIQFLISAGADVNATNDMGDTPLHRTGEPSNYRGYSPTTAAVRVDAARTLIGHGAKVNARNDQGDTPLICAIEDQNVELVRLLLSHGASVNEYDRQGQDALDVAKMWSHMANAQPQALTLVQNAKDSTSASTVPSEKTATVNRKF